MLKIATSLEKNNYFSKKCNKTHPSIVIFITTINESKVLELVLNDSKGELKSLEQQSEFEKLNITSSKDIELLDRIEVCRILRDEMVKGNIVSKKLTKSDFVTTETREKSRSLSNAQIKQAINSDIQAMGYQEYDSKVHFSKTEQGIWGSTVGSSEIQIGIESNYIANLSTSVSVVGVVLGLSAGSLLSVGVFMLTAAGIYETSRKQTFTEWVGKWIACKWVMYSEVLGAIR